MMRALLVLLLAVLLPGMAAATPIIADISSQRVEIYSGFTGTQLLMFGARNDSGDIVLAVRGPQHDVRIRKKKRKAGIWVNRREATFEQVPLYYAVASSRPIEELRQTAKDQFPSLGIYTPENIGQDPFRLAMFRILQQRSLYFTSPQEVQFMGGTLFKSSFRFPDNMPRGTYTAEVYLFSDGQLTGAQSIPIEVVKTGFDAFLYDAAMHHGWLYGLASILIAFGLGWSANWLFKHI